MATSTWNRAAKTRNAPFFFSPTLPFRLIWTAVTQNLVVSAIAILQRLRFCADLLHFRQQGATKLGGQRTDPLDCLVLGFEEVGEFFGQPMVLLDRKSTRLNS